MAYCKECGAEIDFLQIEPGKFLAVDVVDKAGYMERILTVESKWFFVTPHHRVCLQSWGAEKSPKQLTLF